LAREGLKPKGVFVRRGAACIPVNEAGIREMIMETSGKSFEESRSLNQNLSFHTMRVEMERRSLEFGTTQMSTLKMIGADGLYTNLALLLSDQCPYSIKTAIFQDDDDTIFRERKEFTGSLLKQLHDVYQFLDFYNKTAARINGLLREDRRDYPEDAVREALLNSIIHRDYLFSGSTIINIYAGHMEFISLGGLLSGLSLDAIFMGISQSRNPNLAAVFYRLNLVESYGTGVRKIKRLYEGSGYTPEFKTAEGAFTVTMQNRNEMQKMPVASTEEILPETTRKEKAVQINELYQFIQSHGTVTRKNVEDNFGFGSTKAYNLLKRLCSEGKIHQKKQGNQTYYFIEKGL
jgi:ATP-dependent DNA helicase RecG